MFHVKHFQKKKDDVCKLIQTDFTEKKANNWRQNAPEKTIKKLSTKRKDGNTMNIGVSSYSFSAYMGQQKKGIFEVIDKAAEMGFDSIEFTDVYAPEGKDAIEQAKEIRAYCTEKNLPVTVYAISADLLRDPDGFCDILINRELKIAEALGAKMLRHDVTRGYPKEKTFARGFEQNCMPVVVPAIRKVTKAAKEIGIRTMSENHGFFYQDIDSIERLINAVNDENYGLLFDMGNFFCGDDDPAAAAGRLAPYTFHIHAKDFFRKNRDNINPGEGYFRARNGNYLRGTIVGHGDVPISTCLWLMKENGYNGTCSIEFEGCEDCLYALRVGLSNMRRFAEMAEKR